MRDRDRQIREESSAASRWDEEYRDGRYDDEPPVAFVRDIIEAVRTHRPTTDVGLYIGCGNGRNFVCLTEAGLDLVGLDISRTALDQLSARLPAGAARLIHGDLAALPQGVTFGTVIGIQVFQHGTGAEACEHVRAAIDLLVPGGLFCVRVNAVGTEIEYAHRVLADSAVSGLTVRYEDGPKRGLVIHFFARAEIEHLMTRLVPILPLRIQRTIRQDPSAGHWDQWEGIWQLPR
jgi:SAM-dependent methyltransferase